MRELWRIAARLLREARAEALPGSRPGLILFVQTFGDLANFHPHVHVLAADGALLPDGRFVALPPVPEALLAQGFRRDVLGFLVRKQAIAEELRARLLGWRHSGLSVHNQVRVAGESGIDFPIALHPTWEVRALGATDSDYSAVAH